jgi:predicted membrane-bound spermidine synthase
MMGMGASEAAMQGHDVDDKAAQGRALTAVRPAALLFLSGTAALVFQVLWIKQLSLVVGVEVSAIAGAVSAFFLGLALGGWLLGRKADQLRRPVRFYAMLEAGVALSCIAVTWLLARSAAAFVAVEVHSSLAAWLAVGLLLAVPAFLMGGTLPVLLRAVSRQQGADVSRSGGAMYAANTCGAILGALLPAFFLIPRFGVQGAALAAASLNVLAALGAWMLDRRAGDSAAPADNPQAAAAPLSGEARLAVALYAVAGAVALGYEVIWSQMIVPFMSTRAFAFAIVLATYLAGLAIGAALYARWAHRVRNPWPVFGFLIAGAGLIAVLEVALLGKWLIVAQTQAEAAVYQWTGSGFAGMCARFAVAAASLVLAPTLLLGAAFPAVLRIAVGDRQVGREAGAVLACNTLGGIAGTLLTGFLLLPALGLVRTLSVLAAIAAAVGARPRRHRVGHRHRGPRHAGADRHAAGRPVCAATAWGERRGPGVLRGKPWRHRGRGRTRRQRQPLPPPLHPGRIEFGRRHAFAALHAAAGAAALDRACGRTQVRAGRGLWHRHHGGRLVAIPRAGKAGGRRAAASRAARRAALPGYVPGRHRSWPGQAAARRTPRAAGQRRTLGPDHAGAAAAFRRGRGESVFPRLLPTGRKPAGAARHRGAMAAAAHAERRRHPRAHRQLHRGVSACPALDQRTA